MKRLLFLPLLMVALAAFGAAGDYVGASIADNGWMLLLEFSAMGTNGTFADLGFGTNFSLTGNEKVKLSLVSQGFDSSGNATTYQRTLYGTKRIRFAKPSDAFPDVSSNAVSTTIKFALSDFVYSGDSNLTVSASAGVYSNLTVNSAAVVSMPVTNNSIRLYPLPVANWTWPGWNRETNATMRLRAVGFCQTATTTESGQPLACMKFVVTDGTLTKTNTVSRMAIDRTLTDAMPTGEYISDVSLSGFAPYAVGGASGLLWCDFQAYPTLGTASTVLVTTYAASNTPVACTITNLCDTNYVYCNRIAVVDPAGSDANGRVTNVEPASVNSAHYFATLRGAGLQLAATNNAAFGHNDPGGGIIYVRAGITNWTGGANITSVPAAWAIFRPYPGDTIDEITTALTGSTIGFRMKFEQMKFGGSGLLFLTVGTAFWFDRCTLNSSTPNFVRQGLWYATDCNVIQLVEGFRAVTAGMPALVRGNTNSGPLANYQPVYVVIGNLQRSNTAAGIGFDQAAQTVPLAYGGILYNNAFNCKAVASTLINGFASFSNNDKGFAIVQNVFEMSTNNSGALLGIGANNVAITNAILWNNLVLGQRATICYNEPTVATNAVRWQFQSLNNMMDNFNIKTDVTGTGGAQYTNNWEQVFGVSWQGNAWMETSNSAAAPATFMPNTAGGFAGLNTIEHTNVFSPTWPQFVNPQRYDGNTNLNSRTGDGDYRVLSSAPQQGLITKWVLPFDLEGNARGRLDPPGAYSSATPRKGGGFF